MIAIDTETSGHDLRHGCRPFFVSIVDERHLDEPISFHWDVDPFTREVLFDDDDISRIQELIINADKIVLQNAKFDILALSVVDDWFRVNWPWEKTVDTLVSGHILASILPHTLDAMSIQYLGIDIKPYEQKLHECVQEVTKLVKKEMKDPNGLIKDWKLGKSKGELEELPSQDKKAWITDYWLPGIYAKYKRLPKDHIYRTCLPEYGNIDSTITLALWKMHEKKLTERNLWDQFNWRMKVIKLAFMMEWNGVTEDGTRHNEIEKEYQEESERLGKVCVNLASSYGHDLKLPNGSAVNDSLRTLIFDKMKLTPYYNEKAKSDAPTLNKETMELYKVELSETSKERVFISNILTKRKKDKVLQDLSSYKKFRINISGNTFRLYSHVNPTGSVTQRWTVKYPNTQQFSKQELICGKCQGEGEYGHDICPLCKGKKLDPRTVRYILGPAPGREWWSLDASNIELRIPFYLCGDKTLIDLFERPNDPPYYGSYHLLVFDLLHPDKFKQYGKECKKVFRDTWYQWTKNGDFAKQYLGGRKTVDKAFHVHGAYDKINSQFNKLEALNQSKIREARKFGYVKTAYGYPLMTQRTDYGDVIPTTPLSYFVQGTAMGWEERGMIRTQELLDKWNTQICDNVISDGWFDGFITLQVHDEQVLDFPYVPDMGNLWRIKEIAKVMRIAGDEIGVKTEVGCEYHEHNWGEGVTVAI